MPQGKKKILGYDFLNKKYGLFDNTHNYNLSEKSILTREYSFQIWALAYLVSNTVQRLNFDDISFMMMVSDFKYFEEHVLPPRTGWSEDKATRVLMRLLEQGYFRREKPKTENAFYGNLIYKPSYKYYPTHKYKSFLKRLENDFKLLNEQIDLAVGKDVEPPKRFNRS